MSKAFFAKTGESTILAYIIFGDSGRSAWFDKDSHVWFLSKGVPFLIKKPESILSIRDVPKEALQSVMLQNLIMNIFKYAEKGWL